MRCKRRTFLPLAGLLLFGATGRAAVSVPILTTNVSPPQPVGSPITFTATAGDSDAGPLRYRFRVRPQGGTYSTIRDYSPSNQLVWAPSESEGTFEIEVSARNHSTASVAASSIMYIVSPRASGVPVVNPTVHPLVALYSAPPCPAGSSMRVRLRLPTDSSWRSAGVKPCNGQTTMNFYVWGMRASSTYFLAHDVITGSIVASGPTLLFTTGPAGVALPAITVTRPLLPPTSVTEGITLFATMGAPGIAADAAGNVVWYDATPATYITRPVPGGTFLQVFGISTDLANGGFAAIDATGAVVKQTNVERLNDQLLARGLHTITAVHHEVRRLENGGYLLLGETERLSNAQGPNIDILGDMILVLDADLQLQWAWDAFDHLDVSRKAVLNETCTNGPMCVMLNASTANDWTHSNCVAIAPDGNLLLSARHQDRVYKIAYANGTGDGHVIWILGKDGDFQWQSYDPYPWFSHQHDTEFEANGLISLYDNGNTRIQSAGQGHSRGQALQIDEVNHLVTLALNADLGNYSTALGSAQLLSNGNYVFDSGVVNSLAVGEADEVGPGGSIASTLRVNAMAYRTFRLDTQTVTPGITPPADTIASPLSGSSLADLSATFCWTNNNNYLHWLDVGTAPGFGDLYGGYQSPGSSCKTVANLPGSGATIYVKIWSYIDGTLQFTDQSSARYTSPVRSFSPPDGTIFTASTVTFSWAPIAGAQYYWLDVGPWQGNGSIFGGVVYGTVQNVGNIIPTGIPIWARLWAFYGGGLHLQGDHLYTACNGCVSTLTTPSPNTGLNATAQFCWTATAGADHYWLDVGTAIGQGNIYGADQGTATCRTVPGVPTSGVVYVQLWTHIGTDWLPPIRYSYLGMNSIAQIVSPVPGSMLQSSATFMWNAAAGATGYWLDVGTIQGQGNLYAGYQGTGTAQTVNGIPAGTIWVRLWTYIGGIAVPRDFQYTRSTLH
jgi:arylsulfate sulfotransferase